MFLPAGHHGLVRKREESGRELRLGSLKSKFRVLRKFRAFLDGSCRHCRSSVRAACFGFG